MDKIQNVVCLCLDKRKDDWPALEAQVEQYLELPMQKFIVGEGEDSSLNYDCIDKGIERPASWKWYSDIRGTLHYRAHLSHKKILQKAIDNNWDNFLLLEDDAVILDRYNDVMDQLSITIEQLELDFLYLGWHCFEIKNNISTGRNLEVERIWKETRSAGLHNEASIGGFHAVVINNTAFKRLINFPEISPLDDLVNNYRLFFERAIVLPKVIHVKPGWSYCENEHTDREIL